MAEALRPGAAGATPLRARLGFVVRRTVVHAFARVLALAACLLLPGTVVPAEDGASDVRRDVQRALALRDDAERIDGVEAALRGADGEAAADAVLELVVTEDAPQALVGVGVRALGRMTSEGASLALGRAVKSPRRFRRLVAAEALGRSEAATARAQLLELALAEDPRVRAAAVTSLGDRRPEDSVAAFVNAIGDPEWTVRSAAIRGLRLAGGDAARQALALRRSEESGRLLDDLADALRTVGPPPDGDAWTPPPATVASPLFESRSRRVLFVLSTAETMKDVVHRADPDPRVAAAVRQAGEDLAKDLESAKTKLDLARVHLRAMIRGVADGTEFDVLVYSGSPNFAFGQLTRADEASRRKAEARIARISAGGSPNVHEMLHRIFDPRAKDPYDAPDGPDLVVLVSDGALPTDGFHDRNEIAPRAVRWNRARQIRFVTIGVGLSEPYLLGSLAGGPPPGLALSIP